MKTKIILFHIIIVAILAYSFTTTAQEESKYNITKPQRWGVGISLSNAGMFDKLWLTDIDLNYGNNNNAGNVNAANYKTYALSLSGYYKMKGNISFRIKAQMANQNITTTNDTRNQNPHGGSFSSDEENVKQQIISIEPSIIWENKIGKFSIYEGFTVPIILIGKYSYYDYSLITDTLNVPISDGTVTHTLPGGMATGLAMLAGINFNPFNHIKIGMEFSIAFLYSDIEGKFIDIEKVTIPTYNLQTYTDKYKRVRYEFTKLNTSINITYEF